MSQIVRATATGNAVAGDAYVYSVALTAGADAASVAVRDGSAGNVLLTIKAAAGSTVEWRCGDPAGVYFGSAVHVTLTGTAPEVSVEVS